ncbi:MAG: hypothetical protein IKA64_00180 [Clostridia bacterium]|nr:hypothetical protein [Clostridia bacterium]
MTVDLLHNKVVADTLTDRFTECVNEVLLPILNEKYGDGLLGIVMYEDYIADNLLVDGVWYYPLTVRTEDGSSTEWIKWSVNKSFKDGIPYAYVGEGNIDFALAANVPEGLADKLAGRAIDYEEGALGIKIHTTANDPTFLSGKYSQTFIDALVRAIEKRLCRALGVDGFSASSIELEMIFAPGTYMEHTSENVTYRRLLMTDKGCQPRDFWVKWTALDAPSYTVSDHIGEGSVEFELGEDVSQKIREKEYRFLCSANPDKYQAAMGKRTVTEWRELIKRALRRGELVKVEEPTPAVERDEVTDKLAELLGVTAAPAPAAEPEVSTSDEFERAMQMARAALGITEEPEAEEPEIELFDEKAEDEPVEFELFDEPEETEAEPEIELFDEEREDEPVEFELYDEPEKIEEEAEAEPEAGGEIELFEEEPEENIKEDDVPDMSEALRAAEERARREADEEVARLREERIRAEIEAKVRLEYEAAARLRAEEELNRLRAENERLAAAARAAEEQRLEEERIRAEKEARERMEREARAAEEERIRREMQARAEEEAKERERLAEAARLAVEEQRRIDAERRLREEREALVRLEAERAAREEAEARLRAEEERRTELERLRAEAAERAAREAARPAAPQKSYMSKQAKLLFRRAIDVNVIKSIQSIVEETLVKENKENVHIHMKAYPQDNNTINLEILKMPSEEGELLVKIIKAIGNGGLGITKVILEDLK